MNVRDLSLTLPARPTPEPARQWNVKPYGCWDWRITPAGTDEPRFWVEEQKGGSGYLRCSCSGDSDHICPHIEAIGAEINDYRARPKAVSDPPETDLFPSTGAQDYHDALRSDRNDLEDSPEWAETESAP